MHSAAAAFSSPDLLGRKVSVVVDFDSTLSSVIAIFSTMPAGTPVIYSVVTQHISRSIVSATNGDTRFDAKVVDSVVFHKYKLFASEVRRFSPRTPSVNLIAPS